MTHAPAIEEPISVVVHFDVAPEHQHALADAVATFAREVLAPREGFRSATIHRSLDGTTVLNVVEWRRRADYEAYASEPRSEAIARTIIALARPRSTPSVVVARVAAGSG